MNPLKGPELCLRIRFAPKKGTPVVPVLIYLSSHVLFPAVNLEIPLKLRVKRTFERSLDLTGLLRTRGWLHLFRIWGRELVRLVVPGGVTRTLRWVRL